MHTVLLWVPGWGEMLVIMLFVLIFFGAKKIPEIARGMGKGIREFKDATKEIKNEINDGANAANPNPSANTNSETKA